MHPLTLIKLPIKIERPHSQVNMHILSLPNDTLTEIAHKLPIKDLGPLMFTCGRLYALINEMLRVEYLRHEFQPFQGPGYFRARMIQFGVEAILARGTKFLMPGSVHKYHNYLSFHVNEGDLDRGVERVGQNGCVSGQTGQICRQNKLPTHIIYNVQRYTPENLINAINNSTEVIICNATSTKIFLEYIAPFMLKLRRIIILLLCTGPVRAHLPQVKDVIFYNVYENLNPVYDLLGVFPNIEKVYFDSIVPHGVAESGLDRFPRLKEVVIYPFLKPHACKMREGKIIDPYMEASKWRVIDAKKYWGAPRIPVLKVKCKLRKFSFDEYYGYMFECIQWGA